MGEDTLPCQKCNHRFGVEAVLDNCSVSWPNQRWLWFRCPDCRHGAHVGVLADSVSIGGIDGAPGPCFMPSAIAAAPGLRVAASDAAVTVAYKGREWRVQAK